MHLMLTGILQIHSILRYVLLVFLVISIFKSFKGWFGKKQYLPGDKKAALFTLISAHLQLVIGLLLYFISPNVKAGLADMGAAMKDAGLRFWAVEHIGMMLAAIVLITLGYSLAKRGKNDEIKHKRVALFFLLALILIFLAIPWPWSSVSRGWVAGIQ
jgi:cation transport ATPase